MRQANAALRGDVAQLFLLATPTFHARNAKIQGFEWTAPPSVYTYDSVYRIE